MAKKQREDEKMKKKIVLGFMLACMMTALAGCGSAETKEAAATVAETEEDSDGKDGRAEDADKKDSEEKEEKKSFDGPVLGGENLEGYEGFEYLYEELLMTESETNEETGKKERKKLTVYIPDDEYATANSNYAYANTLGVNFRVELEPYLRYDAEDYLPTENLDDYLADKYDPFYTADYKDMVITPAEEAGDGVIATVEYCRYNDWDEVYYSVFCTYYLVELESGETVLVSTEVDNTEVTGKTDGLIEELEQFYQFDINWDKERADKKSADYTANGTDNTYSTGSLLFELPEGWAEDKELSSYDMPVYAPDGDSSFAECMVSVYEEYVSEDVDVSVLTDSAVQELVEEMLGDSVSNLSTEICDTGLGKAAKITCTVTDGEFSADIVMYIVAHDYSIYRLMSVDSPNATENAAMVLDGIMATGQLRE